MLNKLVLVEELTLLLLLLVLDEIKLAVALPLPPILPLFQKPAPPVLRRYGVCGY